MSTAYRVFRALPAPVRGLGERILTWRAERRLTAVLPAWGDAPTRLLVGPMNTAGQGTRWARAAEQHLDVTAISVRAQPRSGTNPLAYPVDLELTPPVQLRGMAPYRGLVLSATHVLAEAGRAVLDDVLHRTIADDLPALADAGIRTGVLIHGSEARDLRVHAQEYPDSPFAQPWDERLERMQATVEKTQRLLETLAGQDVPLLVATPDMLRHVPGSRWLPIVVDVDRFATEGPPLRRDRPVVLHAPTNPRLKGTAAIEEVLGDLHDQGRITYRRLEGVVNADMPAAIAAADVVVDQVVLGNPATLLCETMAAGRLAVAHIAPQVRAAMRDADPAREPIPVVEATPGTLRAAIEGVLADREAAAALAARGPEWARRNHDGARSASVLSDALDLPAASGA